MFDKLKKMMPGADLGALMPALEKQFGLKITDLKTAEEFKAGLQGLITGTGEKTERYMVQGEINGRAAVGILVLK